MSIPQRIMMQGEVAFDSLCGVIIFTETLLTQTVSVEEFDRRAPPEQNKVRLYIAQEVPVLYISRHLEQAVREASAQYPVVMVSGAWQGGKSTMLHHIMEEGRRYVTLAFRARSSAT